MQEEDLTVGKLDVVIGVLMVFVLSGYLVTTWHALCYLDGSYCQPISRLFENIWNKRSRRADKWLSCSLGWLTMNTVIKYGFPHMLRNSWLDKRLLISVEKLAMKMGISDFTKNRFYAIKTFNEASKCLFKELPPQKSNQLAGDTSRNVLGA
jgi:hypothetical protein